MAGTLKTCICVALFLIIDSSENAVLRKKQAADADNVGKASNSKGIVKKLELSDEEFEWEGSGEEEHAINKTGSFMIASSRPNEQVRDNAKLVVSNGTAFSNSTEQHFVGAVKDNLNNSSNRMPIQKRVDAQRFRTRPHLQHQSRLSDFDYYDNVDYEDFSIGNGHTRNPPRYNRVNTPRVPYGYYLPFNPWHQLPNSAQYPRAPVSPPDPYDFYNPYAIYYNPWGRYQTLQGPIPAFDFRNSTANVQQSRYNTQDGQTPYDSRLPETSDIHPTESTDYNSEPQISQDEPTLPTNNYHTTPRPNENYDYRDTNEPASDPYQHTAPTPSNNCGTSNERPPPDPYEQPPEQSHENPYDLYRDNEGDPYDSNPSDDPHPEHESYNHEDSERRPEDQESYNNDPNNRRPPFNHHPGPDGIMQRPPYHGPPPMRRPYYGPQQQGYRPTQSYGYTYGSRYGGLAGLAIIILVTLLIVFLIIASASLTSGRSLNILYTGRNRNIQQKINETDAWDSKEQADHRHEICNFIETICHVTRYARQSKNLPTVIRFYNELDIPPYNSDLGFFIGHTSTLVLKNYVAFECPHLQSLC